jgi:hypothetical protein
MYKKIIKCGTIVQVMNIMFLNKYLYNFHAFNTVCNLNDHI